MVGRVDDHVLITSFSYKAIRIILALITRSVFFRGVQFDINYTTQYDEATYDVMAASQPPAWGDVVREKNHVIKWGRRRVRAAFIILKHAMPLTSDANKGHFLGQT